jgi:hypothetical protein
MITRYGRYTLDRPTFLPSSKDDLYWQSWVRRTCVHCGRASAAASDEAEPLFVVAPPPHDLARWIVRRFYTLADVCPWCEAGDPVFDYVAVCTPVPPQGWEPSLFTRDVLFEAAYGPWLLAQHDEGLDNLSQVC